MMERFGLKVEPPTNPPSCIRGMSQTLIVIGAKFKKEISLMKSFCVSLILMNMFDGLNVDPPTKLYPGYHS